MRPGSARSEWSATVADERANGRVADGIRVHVVALGVGLLVLGVAGIVTLTTDIRGSELSREPQIVLAGEFYAGVVSNIGALVWMVAVVMAAVGAATTRPGRERLMFLAGTFVGAVLLIDDFFLVHDWVGQRWGLIEQGMMLGYLVLLVLLVVVFARELGPVGVLGIVVTLGFLAASALLDKFFNNLDQLVEDGCKFLGICTWAAVWTVRARLGDLERLPRT